MDLSSLLLIVHIIGIALGVGGATVSDVLFLQSIKNKKISADEFANLQAVSKIVWIGFFILLFSGVGMITLSLIKTGSAPMFFLPMFQAKLIIVLLIFINGLVFHFLSIPFLRKNIEVSWESENITSKLPLFAISGGISVVSWYSALILGSLRGIDLPLLFILNIYGILVVGAILVGYFVLNRRVMLQ